MIIDIVVKFATRQVLSIIAKRLPFLGGGIIGWIAGIFISKIVRVLLEKTIIGVRMGLISYEVSKEVKEYNAALDEYLKADTDEKKTIAKDKVIESACDIIDFN